MQGTEPRTQSERTSRRTTMTGVATVMLAMTMSAACSNEPPAGQDRNVSMQSRQVNWSVLSDKRIFFAHQSVGSNILEGISRLPNDRATPLLRVVETASAGEMTPGVLAHARVGQNGDPFSKIAAFEKYMDSGVGGNADIALFKFCYVDVEASTDVAKIFDAYKTAMQALEARYPRTRFIHVTMPLRPVQTGPKAVVKRLLGRPAGGYVENVLRNTYNDLLRRAYAGRAPVYDLAALESTLPDGRTNTFTYQGREFFALARAYTPDNGHLNEHGQRLAAEALLTTLAGAAGAQ